MDEKSCLQQSLQSYIAKGRHIFQCDNCESNEQETCLKLIPTTRETEHLETHRENTVHSSASALPLNHTSQSVFKMQ